MLISRKKIAKEKVSLIMNGQSAYCESKELARLIKKELQSLNIDVHEDVTNIGSWFIPVSNEQV
ncbi:hypothetical protein [Pseudalkalibacillus caeni]|uniref:Uncharacterized protein n=1 Tax=Exobacillus caeni TaxID=2574798 RepID=A0A5R9FBT7_9BACL|nr:hypothetical protein [Pseudalkalibacillus caeni]TLS39128.1 hypothetical protein FCL54_02105 [Pseudalkalibacillus caeni]